MPLASFLLQPRFEGHIVNPFFGTAVAGYAVACQFERPALGEKAAGFLGTAALLAHVSIEVLVIVVVIAAQCALVVGNRRITEAALFVQIYDSKCASNAKLRIRSHEVHKQFAVDGALIVAVEVEDEPPASDPICQHIRERAVVATRPLAMRIGSVIFGHALQRLAAQPIAMQIFELAEVLKRGLPRHVAAEQQLQLRCIVAQRAVTVHLEETRRLGQAEVHLASVARLMISPTFVRGQERLFRVWAPVWPLPTVFNGRTFRPDICCVWLPLGSVRDAGAAVLQRENEQELRRGGGEGYEVTETRT